MVFSLKPGNLEMAGNQTLEPGTDRNSQNLELILAQLIDLEAGIDCTAPNGKYGKQKQIQKTILSHRICLRLKRKN